MHSRHPRAALDFTDTFLRRHTGPSDGEIKEMLSALELDSLEQLVNEAVPDGIRLKKDIDLGVPRGEQELLQELREVAQKNQVWRSYIGMGYAGTHVPPVIQRNILENPGWYTQYTPYQAEISQGRLEALLAFQTMCSDLCGLDIANASMLDEGTAAAEAMTMMQRVNPKNKGTRFLVDERCHPQTIALIQTRAEPLGIEVVVGAPASFDFAGAFGCCLAYPATDGTVVSPKAVIDAAHAADALAVVVADLLSLLLLKSPGELGADIAVGNAQRFGVPMGFGGPHAAFFATRESYQRQIPGRLVGVSKDKNGDVAYRLALQTREQHIRREKATSNICTAQVLLAIMSGMYGVYHGPRGLKRIATRVHDVTRTLATGLKELGIAVDGDVYFDTLRIKAADVDLLQLRSRMAEKRINLRHFDDDTLCVALDETVSRNDLRDLLYVFGGDAGARLDPDALIEKAPQVLSHDLCRKDVILTHPVFERYRSETEMLRYLYRLQGRDLSLTTSMIPLGSCTMKLNGTIEMLPVTWPEFGNLHPFAPGDQTEGYQQLFSTLSTALAEITGLPAVSLQPNAGSQGEYTGLLVIRAYHHERGDHARDICIIPQSAHGTNPASATMAGMQVVVVKCDKHGNIDTGDLAAKCEQHKEKLAALMVTYPSTHGVFESSIEKVCQLVHDAGGQVYLDGANMNAQVGLCRPGDYGADVIHLNLHKTFCIPHGGGGPGMGPICVAEHLAPFLPGHPVVKTGGDKAIGPVSAAPWSSASILPISWMYIHLLGTHDLTDATGVAILNANYMARRLEKHFPILYRGESGRVAHEFIVNCKGFEDHGVKVEDIAKRLMDYGFHAPTMSFPVVGTLMIEPTESESKEELDRLCDALILIKEEIDDIASGKLDKEDNPLKNAPHTAAEVCSDSWEHKYSRERADFPAPWTRENKFWPPVGRVDNVFGDRNLFCSCPPLEEFEAG